MSEKPGPQRLWIVSELYFPEDTSTGRHVTQIAEALAGRFDVNILCGQPTYALRGTRAPKTEVRNGVKIFRAAGTTLDKNVLPLRAINMLTLGFFIFWKALFKFTAGDRVMVVTTPPTMPFIIAVACLIKGTPLTLVIYDQYPEVLVAAKKISPSSPINGIVEFFNRWLFKYVTRVVVIGRDMKELVQRKAKGLGVPISVVPMWADVDEVWPEPRENNEFLRELKVEDKLVLLYSGNMGTTHDLESLYAAAKELVHENVHFIFAGSGAKRKWLDAAFAAEPLPNVTLMQRQPIEKLNTLLNACDVALVTTVDRMFGVSVPSRAANVMATGRPILAMTDPRSELALVIDEEQIGWHVPPEQEQLLLDQIRVINKMPREELREMGRRARTAAELRYRFDERIERYAEALQ